MDLVNFNRNFVSVAAAAVLLASAAQADAQNQVRKMFESGQYQQVIEAAGPDAEPGVVYMAALSQQKAGAGDQAVAAARRLGELPEDNAWHFVGQLGLVQARRQEWREAAESFDRVVEADPSNAYAYYYAGLMHYRGNRTDLMAVRFERFLKLAPEAPERPEVMQIMRTIRGR
jgi:tetratricopeptide (TPR) repeat protein